MRESRFKPHPESVIPPHIQGWSRGQKLNMHLMVKKYRATLKQSHGLRHLVPLLLLAGLAASYAATPPEQRPPTRFAWEFLRANEVSAAGWMQIQAAEDLKDGLPGHMDEINDDVAHESFVHANYVIEPDRQPPIWWMGEQEGYWYEGKVHLAFLAGDTNAIQQVTTYVNAVLKNQAKDGYIGVYGEKFRLLPVNDPIFGDYGGELHSQAQAFLALLAFYEHTGRKDVLAAVERAVQLSMKTYQAGVFATAGKKLRRAGGNSHTVNFIDPLTQLYRLTGNEAYLKFIAFMYQDYNLNPPRDQDLTVKALTNSQTLFVGHGAHTAESFHMVQAAALTGNDEMQKLPALALAKLEKHLTPGGALLCDEHIKGRLGQGQALYEHCTQHELVKSFGFISQYTGNPVVAARAARLFFNGIQGACLHPIRAMQYLSRDDRTDIRTDPAKSAGSGDRPAGHFQMSSIVRPACCAASAGRGLPYYLAGSWLKNPAETSLAIMNFAPSTIQTVVAGVNVKIQEVTEYPFQDQVVLNLTPEKEVAFELAIRQPLDGELQVLAAAGAKISRRNGLLILNKTWKAGDRVELKLDLPVVLEKTADGKAYYYRRGDLVFGLPFQSDVKVATENPRWKDQTPSGLFEYDVTVADKSQWGYRIDPTAKFTAAQIPGDPQHPWNRSPLGIQGTMLDAQGKSVPVTLVPEGSAISRRVTFLDAASSAEAAARPPQEFKVGIGF